MEARMTEAVQMKMAHADDNGSASDRDAKRGNGHGLSSLGIKSRHHCLSSICPLAMIPAGFISSTVWPV